MGYSALNAALQHSLIVLIRQNVIVIKSMSYEIQKKQLPMGHVFFRTLNILQCNIEVPLCIYGISVWGTTLYHFSGIRFLPPMGGEIP